MLKFWLKIVSEILAVTHHIFSSNFKYRGNILQTFLAKSRRNWSATMRNMAKFPLKIQLTILKRNEKFSFRL